MFSFGHCPNEGGGGRALPELKNTLYIFLFDGRKSCTSCPNWGEGGGGGGGIWAMPERKHSFLKEGFPNSELMSLPKELLILTPLSTSVYSLCWKTSVKLSTSGLVKPCRPPTRRMMFQRRRGQEFWTFARTYIVPRDNCYVQHGPCFNTVSCWGCAYFLPQDSIQTQNY